MQDTQVLPGSSLRKSLGEGNDNPLQFSCLGNPMDRGAWWATVHGIMRVEHNLVTKQQLWLLIKQYSIFFFPLSHLLMNILHSSELFRLVFGDHCSGHKTMCLSMLRFLPVYLAHCLAHLNSSSMLFT